MGSRLTEGIGSRGRLFRDIVRVGPGLTGHVGAIDWAVVVGGRGGHLAVIPPWALHSEAIVEREPLPNGKISKSIDDFRVS